MTPSHTQTAKKHVGKERRAYPRYPVVLQSTLTNPAQISRSAIIKDYCIGGMFIELVDNSLMGGSTFNPAIGEELTLTTKIEHNGAEQTLRFTIKVMRAESGYIGVAFVNPDLSAVQSLHKFAAQKNRANGGDYSSAPDTFKGKPAKQILQEAHQLVASELKPLMQKFHASISDHFFEAARETYDMAKQNALFDSLGTLEKNKNRITQAFIESYTQKIKNYSPESILHEEEKQEENEISLDNLSLVEEDELDNWLSISSIINNVDADNRDELSKIERRASVLYKAKINKKNNPFGPALFAQAFQDAIDDIEIQHAVKLVCYTAFRDIYIKIAPDLYKTLNKFFIDNDVLPKLKFAIDRSKTPKRAASAAAPAVEEEEPQFEGDFMDSGEAPLPPLMPGGGGGAHAGAAPQAGIPQGGMASGAGATARPGVAPQPGAGGVAPAAGTAQAAQGSAGQATAGHQTNVSNIPAAGAAPMHSPEQGRELVRTIHQQQQPSPEAVQSPGLLDVFSDIRGLQSNLEQVHAGVPSEQITSNPEAAAGANVQYFSPGDLLNALSSQQLAGYDYAEQADDKQKTLKDKIQNILASQGIENKVISAREGQIIDIASNVFQSLMSDMQVAESIRPWIRQLEVPVLKMAITDHNVFTDTSHIVRQVINKIAELEVLADSEDEKEQDAIKRAFDWLVKVINEDFDGTPKVFQRIAQQLDILIKIQSQTFEKNLQTVIDEVLKEEETSEDTEAEEVELDIEDKWARQVSRIEEGDWILFDAFSEVPTRLKVGWVARKKNKFVFVNVLGKKEKVLTADELIELFKEGETLALDAQDEPAMDRAQYSMLQKLHKQLLFQSSHDALTGLINRREFENAVAQAIDDAKISNGQHALCYIDLDKFGVINNSCGYEGGDALLREIAGLIKKRLGENSVLSRFNGDEFGILLCGYNTDQALEFAENILHDLNEFRFVWEDKRLSVAMSIGLISIRGHGQAVSKVLQNAESSCGVAKEIGGHRVQVYHEGHARLNKRSAEVQWAAKIDKALDNDALHLRCQRIMPLATDDSYHDHYEILLGMTDDLGEQSSLQEFIRAAENYKRMADIDRWVIKTAFKWIADNRTRLDHVSSFSINLSGHSLNDLGLMEFVMKQMRKTNVPIGKICFEITETLGIANLSDASDFIKRFKTTGCKFSLDDFGSGMSSYGYLKSLPVDYLKIDGVFVKEMATNPNDYAVVKSISEIGHFMGKKIIAEYVQDDETIELLQDLGIDYAQGYGIEKPRALDDILL